MRAATTGIILFASCFSLFAQKQSSFWLHREANLDFNSYPPQVISTGSNSTYQYSRASVADSLGNLQFFTDGLSYFDRNGAVMPNGKPTFDFQGGWGTTALPFVIAPLPKSKFKYLAFVVRLPASSASPDFDLKLRYSVIDMSLNNGKGDVIERNTEIAPYQRDEFTLIRTHEDTEGYWLVTIGLESKHLMAYRVTSAGVGPTPVLTNTGDFIEQTAVLKASPDGRYLAIRNNSSNGTRRLRILKFNSMTGTFSSFRELETRAAKPDTYPEIDVQLDIPEFSKDSRFIYMMSDSLNKPSINEYSSYSKLLCYDLNTSNDAQFKSSKQVLFSFQPKPYPTAGFLQLTPQGKIVLADFQNSGYIHTIHHPESCSISGKMFEYRAISVATKLLFVNPQFPAWYFYTPQVTAINKDFAGNDAVICPNETALLGKNPLPDYLYQWVGSGLSSSNTANPTYIGKEILTGLNDTVRFDLKIIDPEGCLYFDSVSVVTKGVRQWNILGSKSVCPGAKAVQYHIAKRWQGKELTWKADGGTISGSNAKKDTILVDWNTSNLLAAVSATSLNTNGCYDKVDPFAVKVFKYLDTEKPNGRDTLLCGQNLETYQIAGTNGSVYEWVTINGIIKSGQGDSHVDIEWDSAAFRSSVWINESVNTALETCFGRSDTLHIINPRRVTGENVLLNTISVAESDNSTLTTYFQILKPFFYKPNVILLSRDIGMQQWNVSGTTDKMQNSASFCCFPLDQNIMEFKLLASNLCGDSVSSTSHRNILLKAEAFEAENYIQLTWSPYESWLDGVNQYVIYRNVDDQKINDGLNMDNSGSSMETHYHYEKITDGFKHNIRVEAHPADASLHPSLSNSVILEFKNDLIFPNVITPNGDALNDTWKPYPLELYSENEVTIFNRWGQQVYHQNKYRGDWGADGISDGIYFYEFRNPRLGSHRGFVQIVR